MAYRRAPPMPAERTTGGSSSHLKVCPLYLKPLDTLENLHTCEGTLEYHEKKGLPAGAEKKVGQGFEEVFIPAAKKVGSLFAIVHRCRIVVNAIFTNPGSGSCARGVGRHLRT